ncbi:hypothetical protein [Pseudonocardia sp. D17]|jgi:hypothetical protein|uniref:hypothetical protein n=1 Tax=Pseudonocardia sp. D17 TaxID=882661 RepID=UPI002B37879C|nr:hypothetical protein PSD17_05320 [Pseudonocardia sp. D17]
MSDTTTPSTEPVLRLPPQVRPVERDEPREGAAQGTDGVVAAGCGDLTGMARELCYASQYGVYF